MRESLQPFLRCAIAYYLGDLTPKESIAEAYMRALGYPNSYEFHKAQDANDPDYFERVRLARSKRLAKFGVSPEHEWEEIGEAVRRMDAGLPELYKACYRWPDLAI